MDSFESIVKTIFESKGYWVKSCFKVDLTKEEKRKIGRPSSPRWEIDIIAYKGGTNELLAIECKSYLDSPGVQAQGLNEGKYQERYKLFNEPILRNVVLNRLKEQLVELGSCSDDTKIKLCLATGKIYSINDRELLKKQFNENDWVLFSDEWVKEELINLAKSGYEDEVATVTTKIITRNNG
jgi:hypothetical protein